MVSTRIYNFPVISVPDNADGSTKEIGWVELTFSEGKDSSTQLTSRYKEISPLNNYIELTL